VRHGLALVRGPRAEVERRRARLERFLAPLECAWSTRWSGELALVLWEAPPADRVHEGAAVPDRDALPGPPALSGRWTWGERLPEALDAPERLLAASDAELRALDGSHACFAVVGERARVVTGGGGPGGCFAAADERVGAWATSAAAAALLGSEGLTLDVEALPALLAFGALLGERTHVAGVTAVAPGVRIDLAPGAPPERVAYWPRGERWAPLPEADADAAARAALLETLGTRLPREPAPWLALTAGRDSPVLAAACALLGLPVASFTFGDAEWPDVAGARAIATQMGLEHHHHALGALPAADVPAEADRDARWFDGLAGVGPTGPPELPAEMSAMVTGAGAEVGRAYAYQAVARSRRRPRAEHLVATLDPAGRLPGAPAAAQASAAAALRSWLEEPGVPAGWRALDALYVEHRVGRWGTARVPRTHPGPILAPFSAPPVARALSALPLDDRLAVAFHRRLVAEVAPGVALPPMPTQRRGVPAPLRRAAAALREGAAARRAGNRRPFGAASASDSRHPGAALSASGSRSGAAATGVAPWPWAGLWHARPALRVWVADDLLADPRLGQWLGTEWAAALRAGFLADDARHAERALLVASLVLFARAAEAA